MQYLCSGVTFLSIDSACSMSPLWRASSAFEMVILISSGVPANSWMASCITLAASCCPRDNHERQTVTQGKNNHWLPPISENQLINHKGPINHRGWTNLSQENNWLQEINWSQWTKLITKDKEPTNYKELANHKALANHKEIANHKRTC